MVALARISRQGPAGRLSVTIGGDGLRELTPPFGAFLYEPPPHQRKNNFLLEPTEKGLDPAGQLYPVEVVMATASGKTGGVTINPLPDIASGIEGCWLCVERERLTHPEELFFFEMREFAVVDAESGETLARVEDYLETAAHGILVTRTPDDKEVLLPIVEQYVRIERENKLIRVKGFADFM